MTENLHLLLPEFLLAALAVVVLAIDLFLPQERKNLLAWLSVAGLAGILALSLPLLWDRDVSLYGGLVEADRYALLFKAVFLVLGMVVILGSADFVKKRLRSPGEFYAIILFAVLAMSVMASAVELLTAYIALELMSFSFYIMVAYGRNNPKSNEAGVKYILIGAFSSAILLYGVSLLYGVVGVTRYAEIEAALAAALTNSDAVSPTLWIGLGLILVGLGFKIAAVPFHMWAPDTYEGAPLPVTAFLSVGSKVAAFALLLRLFGQAFMPAIDQWQILVAVLAAVTMTLGNVVAISQRNFKRLLAYSSIGHVGFMLLGIAALSAIGAEALILYMVGYAVTSMTVFVGLIAFFNVTGRENVSDLNGLADSHPFIAAAIAIGLFSLAGLPFFAGFTIKFYLFTAAATQGLLWLSGLAMFNSLISLYYYLVVVRHMYVDPLPTEAPGTEIAPDTGPGQPRAKPSILITAVLGALVLGVIFVGVYPFPLLEAIKAAVGSLLPLAS